MLRWVEDLATAAGVCIRIKSIPCAFSYVAHLRCFLGLWFFFLPFALVESTGWATIIVVSFIAYGIIGIEAISMELESPFGNDFNDLPLGRFAKTTMDSVAVTYHMGKKGGCSAWVHEVPDPDLTSSKHYWLAPEETVKKE